MSDTFISDMLAKRLPSSTMFCNNWYKVPDGSLYGKKVMLSLIAPPGTSTSLNSPGIMGVSSPFIRKPLAFKPPGRLDKVPASTNCLSIDVADLANPPTMCIKPKP